MIRVAKIFYFRKKTKTVKCAKEFLVLKQNNEKELASFHAHPSQVYVEEKTLVPSLI